MRDEIFLGKKEEERERKCAFRLCDSFMRYHPIDKAILR